MEQKNIDFVDDLEEEEAEPELTPSIISEAVVWNTDWTVETVITQLTRNNIDMPEFQRRDAWARRRKSRYIESLILGFPIPQIILAERREKRGSYLVLDGKQRLLSILQFTGNDVGSKNNNFRLQGLEVLKDFNQKTLTDINRDSSLRSILEPFYNQPIRSVIIRNWPNASFLHMLFVRLNSETLPLSPQELRQALFPGDFVRYADEASRESQAIKILLGLNPDEPDLRMRDVELLVRYLSFSFYLSEHRGNLKDFLDNTCKKLNKSWPETEDVVLFDQTMSDDAKRAFIYQPGAPRENYDMFSSDSLFYFARTRIHDENERIVCFALRSPDRGRTWESVPTVFEHPDGPDKGLLKDCHPVVRMPDGQTLLAAMSLYDPGAGVALYKSTDNGLSWNYQQRIAGPTGNGRFTYAGLLLLPSGELQLYTLHIGIGGPVNGTNNAICMRSSFNGGQTWDEIRPIVSLETQAAWGASSPPPDKVYRSPWAMILNDGRILVVFGRRYHVPKGYGGIISKDGGQTWSNEFVIRDDALSSNLGYPIGAQMEDGRIIITHYFGVDDNHGENHRPYGGTRAIIGSRFRIE